LTGFTGSTGYDLSKLSCKYWRNPFLRMQVGQDRVSARNIFEKLKDMEDKMFKRTSLPLKIQNP